MKKVKFNGSCIFPYIPDANFENIKDKIKQREETTLDADEYMIKVNPFWKGKKHISVKSGDIVDVPNWFYEANKDRMVEKFLHIPQFNFGNKQSFSPFKIEQAIQHEYLKEDKKITAVKFIELIEDLDIAEEENVKKKYKKKDNIEVQII